MHTIEKLDQRQKPTKWAQLLGTGFIHSGFIDFYGLGEIPMRPFTIALFPAILSPLFYHLGTPFMILFALTNLYHKRRPDGSSIFRASSVQN